MDISVEKITSFKSHTGGVYALEGGVSEHQFFSGSSDKFMAQWNLQTLDTEKFAAQFPSLVYSICYVAERGLLFVGTYSGDLHIIDLEKKEELKILKHHTSAIFDIKCSSLTNQFFTVSGDGSFGIGDLNSLSIIKVKQLCKEKVRSISINTQCFEIAVAAGDGNIRIYDLYTMDEKLSFVAHQLSANKVCYSADGKMLLSGGRDAYFKVWNAEKYELVKSIAAHNFAIYDIVYSPDATLIATASRDKTIKLWDASTFDILVRINKENYDGHLNSVNKLLWNASPNYLVSASDDRQIMVWSISY